jgi:thiamine biosynthesis lipoprotein
MSTAATAPVDARYEFSQVHMGVPVRLTLYAPDESRARAAAAAAFSTIGALEDIFSDYRPDSEVSRIARRHDEDVPVSGELFAVLSRSLDIARSTNGAFDPTVGPLVALWREARRTGRLPERSAMEAARGRVGWTLIDLHPTDRTVRLRKPGMRLDLGGIAKGYILQAAVLALADHQIPRALIEAGGDIVAGDPPPGRNGWRVDLPADAGIDPAFMHRAAHLSNAALASSGPTFQFVEIGKIRYSHVIDPRQGLGVTDERVVRVIARDAATADALATALSVTGPDAIPDIMARFPGVFVVISKR